MSITAGIMLPHPPLIVPAVGRGEESKITATAKACEKAAAFVAQQAPKRVIITSPHATAYADYFHISPGGGASGSFAQFGAPNAAFRADYDREFTKALSAAAEREGFPAGTLGERDKKLDHATMVPLYFLEKTMDLSQTKFVRIGLSGLTAQEHYRLGILIKETAEKLGGNTVFIASGDLSHRLSADGPYGYNEAGPKYDARIMDVMGRGAFGELFDFSEEECEEAGECGQRSFVIMAGAFDGRDVKAEKLSYEGPFGVGYGVCTFTAGANDESRRFLALYEENEARRTSDLRKNEDQFVRLARASIESFVKNGTKLSEPADLPPELTKRRAGVFVSLKKEGRLRGCIGTTSPTQSSVAREIIQNAISAATQDPRFEPVRPDELEKITCSVDVLGPTEPIASESELDVQKFGVIVTRGARRGLLLPNLEGVGSVRQQIEIAKQKAGIRPDETVSLERFEVVRHY
ncbi:MAG: AmmeMemoRadiSam system protein A [Cloacibacillus sp.]